MLFLSSELLKGRREVVGTTKAQRCEGSRKAPREVTMKPRGRFSGYGKCSMCNTECALQGGLMMAHKVR